MCLCHGLWQACTKMHKFDIHDIIHLVHGANISYVNPVEHILSSFPPSYISYQRLWYHVASGKFLRGPIFGDKLLSPKIRLMKKAQLYSTCIMGMTACIREIEPRECFEDWPSAKVGNLCNCCLASSSSLCLLLLVLHSFPITDILCLFFLSHAFFYPLLPCACTLSGHNTAALAGQCMVCVKYYYYIPEAWHTYMHVYIH